MSTEASPVQRSSWSGAWNRLSPNTRRNVKVLGALGIIIDTAVLVNYKSISSWFTGKELGREG